MRDSAASILRYVIVGLAITAIVVGAKVAFEHTSAGHRLEVAAYELLQGQLSPFDTERTLPVVVLDISNIGESKDGEVIDLQRLTKLVGAIADQKPRAIGIDVVLIPEPDEPGLEKDRQQIRDQNYFNFLDFCLKTLKQERKIPVYLGVGERTPAAPEQWLGGYQYKELAATIIIPKGPTTRLPIWFKAEPESEKLFSLGAALARSYPRVHLPSGLGWAVESVEDEFPGSERHLQEDMEYADALINYSKLEAIEQNKLLTVSENSVRESGEKFRDRIVLLGDGTKAQPGDGFVVVGRNEPFSGVYLHAAATFTFAREPMYEFKYWVRFALDLLLSAFILLYVAVVRYRKIPEHRIFNWHKFQTRVLIGILIGIAIAAILLARFSGILWLDFLSIIIALVLHSKIESKFARSK